MEIWVYINIASTCILLGIKFIRGEVRCYCNEASCVNKGYMCKSFVNRCFTVLTPDGVSSFRSIHGCAEHLSDRLATACDKTPSADFVEYDTTGSGGVDHFRARVVCCADDMCNYNADAAVHPFPLDSPDDAAKTNSRISAMQAQTTPDRRPHEESVERKLSRGHGPAREEALWRDIWFRAAVIAVPIAGLVILVLLIILAVRMLRGDYVIKSSAINCSAAQLSVTIDDHGMTRTALATSGESEHSVLTSGGKHEEYTDLWEDNFDLKFESPKRQKRKKYRLPSDSSVSDICDLCGNTHTKSLTIHKNRNDLPV